MRSVIHSGIVVAAGLLLAGCSSHFVDHDTPEAAALLKNRQEIKENCTLNRMTASPATFRRCKSLTSGYIRDVHELPGDPDFKLSRKQYNQVLGKAEGGLVDSVQILYKYCQTPSGTGDADCKVLMPYIEGKLQKYNQ